MNYRSILLFLVISFSFVSQVHATFDYSKVENDWLSWTNEERQKVGAPLISYSDTLRTTATSWSETSKTKGKIDHKRPGQKAYYDYKKIGAWFASKGVSFKKVKSTTFSESIGWNTYSCAKSDCTTEVSAAIHKTFLMYLKEKGKKTGPHYKSMINPLFKQIGVGIVLDEAKRKYYLTVHYGTEVVLK